MHRKTISAVAIKFIVLGYATTFAVPAFADDDPPTVFLMDNNNSETTCNGLFHDSGGPCDTRFCDCISSCFFTEYEADETFVKTFRPQNGLSQKLRINFTTFILEETPAAQPLPFDRFEIYDGNSTSAPLIGVFFPRTDGTGTAPGIITSTAPDGSLTFKFVSDNTFSEEGWDASISCVDAYSPTFLTSGQSMWGSGTTPKPPNSQPVEFLTIPFGNNDLSGTVVSILGRSFGARLFGGITGDLGFQIRFKDIGSGLVGARYPAQVTLSGPPADSYRAGDIITIESFVRVKPESAPYLDMATPQVTMNIEARIGLTASAGAQACVFNCQTANVFPPINLSGTGRIVGLDTVRNKATVIDEEFIVTSTPVTIPALLTLATGISGSLDTPSIGVPANPGSISVVGRTALQATGSDFFTRITMDVDKWILKALGTPAAVALESPCVPGVCSDPPGEIPLLVPGVPIPILVRFLILDLLLDTDFHEQFTYSFAPTLHASLVFPQPLQHTVRRGSTVLHSGTSTVIEFNAGDSIDVVVPDADIGGTPTFSLSNTQFTTETSTRVVRSYREKALQLGIRVPSVRVGCIPRACVLGVCTPRACFDSPEFNFSVGPLVNLNVTFDEFTDTRLFQKHRHNFQLGGFSSVVDSPFAINPEFQPVARIDGPVGPVNEGDAVPFNASPSTDGDNNPLVFAWDFGDGGTGQGPTTGENITHAYGDNGEYTVTLIADDGHGLPGVTTQTVTVLNVAPSVPAPVLSIVNLDEGELFRLDTSATDPGFLDKFYTDVNWGDGTTVGSGEQLAAEGPILFFDHAYADDGEYAISFCVRDDDGGEDCESLTTIVTNLPPTCEVLSSVETSATPPASAVDLDMRLVASFNDPGTLDTHNAPAGSSWIDWDDGTTTVFEVSETPRGPPGSEFGANGQAFGLFDHSFTDRRTADRARQLSTAHVRRRRRRRRSLYRHRRRRSTLGRPCCHKSDR